MNNYPGPTPAIYDGNGALTQMSKSTAGLRWFQPKALVLNHAEPIRLQQYWAVETYHKGECTGAYGEWRDVPMESE